MKSWLDEERPRDSVRYDAIRGPQDEESVSPSPDG